jgi:hypothetical protein
MERTGTLRSILVGATLTATIVASAGCGAGDSPSRAASEYQVPAGVTEQYATMEEEIAANGGETTSGDWRVGYIVEHAEPWFADGRPASYRAPAAGETHHIEVLPIEKSTGRVVPDVPIRLEILDSTGKVIDADELLSLYGAFFHYANNFSVPRAGTYTLRATLAPPEFGRHGEQHHGPKLASGATVEFRGVELKPA